MWVDRIDTVKPCISDPWKLRVILCLDEPPDLPLLAHYLEGRYSKQLDLVMVRSGHRELNFFANGKVTVREVNHVDEAENLVNHLLTLANHRCFVKEEWEHKLP